MPEIGRSGPRSPSRGWEEEAAPSVIPAKAGIHPSCAFGAAVLIGQVDPGCRTKSHITLMTGTMSVAGTCSCIGAAWDCGVARGFAHRDGSPQARGVRWRLGH